MSRIDNLIDDIRHLMDDEGRQTLAAIQAEVDDLQDEVNDCAYDAGYREGLANANARVDIIEELVEFMNGVQIHKQPHGFIAFNGSFFGFGDTPDAALVMYLKQAAKAILV